MSKKEESLDLEFSDEDLKERDDWEIRMQEKIKSKLINLFIGISSPNDGT